MVQVIANSRCRVDSGLQSFEGLTELLAFWPWLQVLEIYRYLSMSLSRVESTRLFHHIAILCPHLQVLRLPITVDMLLAPWPKFVDFRLAELRYLHVERLVVPVERAGTDTEIEHALQLFDNAIARRMPRLQRFAGCFNKDIPFLVDDGIRELKYILRRDIAGSEAIDYTSPRDQILQDACRP